MARQTERDVALPAPRPPCEKEGEGPPPPSSPSPSVERPRRRRTPKKKNRSKMVSSPRKITQTEHDEHGDDDDDDEYYRPPSGNGEKGWRIDTSADKENDGTGRRSPTKKSLGVRPSRFHRAIVPDEAPSAAAAASAADHRRPPRAGERRSRASSSSYAASPVVVPAPPPTAGESLKSTLEEAERRLVQRQKKNETTLFKVKRDAFREVTRLRTWPLQDLALADLDKLMAEHLGFDGADEGGDDGDTAAGVKDDGGKEGASGDSGGKGGGASSPPGHESDTTSASLSAGEGATQAKIPRRHMSRSSRKGRVDRSSLSGSISPKKCEKRAEWKLEFLKERDVPAGVPPPGMQEEKEEDIGIVVGGSESQEESAPDARAEAKVISLTPSRKNFGRFNLTDGGEYSDDDEINDGQGKDLGAQSGERGVVSSSSDEGDENAGRPPAFLAPLWCLEPRIFSVEKSSAGNRRYVVGHLGRFLDLYWRKADPRVRHYYELIREDTPCRLYLDLEFEWGPNPDIGPEDADQLVEELIEEMLADLRRTYRDSLPREVRRRDIVDLDSSTPKKFSRHLIAHLPGGALFRDATACGAYVKSFVGRLAEEIATGGGGKDGSSSLSSHRPVLARHLFVKTKPPKGSNVPSSDAPLPQTCFVDLGVYTRNRLFRLLGSAKFGKPPGAALRIAAANEFPFPDGFDNSKFYIPDQERAKKEGAGAAGDGAGGAEDEDGSGDDYERSYHPGPTDDDMKKFRSKLDWSVHAEALAATLVVPANGSKIAFPVLPHPPPASGGLSGGELFKASAAVKREGSGENRECPPASAYGGRSGGSSLPRQKWRNRHGPSPFPLLDAFVEDTLASRGGSSCGTIRCWSTLDGPPPCHVPLRITYQIKGNRYCERIGREHKSNGIMWTADFNGGGRPYFYQTCHDPDCRGFRGEVVDVPEDAAEEASEVRFEMELGAMDEPTKSGAAVPAEDVGHEEGDGDAFGGADESFEKALMALDISGKRNGGECATASAGGIRVKEEPRAAAEEEDWDAALSQALCDNPELFP